jgi:hypothetical protein
MMSKNISVSKSDLAAQYGVSLDQLQTWLIMWEADLKKLYKYKRKQKLLTPAQVNFLHEKLGRP